MVALRRLIIDYLAGLVTAAEAHEPQKLAEQLALLKEGAILTAQVRGIDDAARQAKQILATETY